MLSKAVSSVSRSSSTPELRASRLQHFKPMNAAQYLLVIAILSFGSLSHADPALLPIDFDLRSMTNTYSTSEPKVETPCYGPQRDSLKTLGATLRDPRLAESMRPKAKITQVTTDAQGRIRRDSIYVYQTPDELGSSRGDQAKIMGFTSAEALRMSRDNINTAPCAPGHEQGDMANRWCHSAISQTFSHFLEKQGVGSAAASIAGGIFWAPKEFFIDMNPSAHDLVVTYRDKLGTKRSTFEVTVFGDTVFDNHVTKVKPFSGSAPMFSWTRKLGPRSRD